MLQDVKIINLRPIVAETGPIGTGTAPTPAPPPVGSAKFVRRHKDFINQVNALDHCFSREEIYGFEPDELEEHIQVALQDNFIVEDGDTGRFCTGQIAWRLRERTKGYVYERL